MSTYTVKITQKTFLKLEATQAADLPTDKKYEVSAGTELPITGFVEHDEIHFRFTLGLDKAGKQLTFPGPEGQDRNTWLVFEGHCLILDTQGKLALTFLQNRAFRLQDFLEQDLKIGLYAIVENKVLAIQIQERLIELGLLSSVADGDFSSISINALEEFQTLMQCSDKDFLSKVTAQKLLEAKPDDIPKPKLKLKTDLASRIIKYMQAKNYNIATGKDEYNIVYLEGANSDGTLNANRPNEFNDRRIVITFSNGEPKIVGNWQGTTEPGSKSYEPGAKTAPRIKFGQYKAWRAGFHKPGHRALVQAKPIPVHRDTNQDKTRSGDFIETGNFGINQHHGFNHPTKDIYNASVGCLVGRLIDEHAEFMAIVEKDKRYLASSFTPSVYASYGDPNERSYVFETTVIDATDFNKRFPSV